MNSSISRLEDLARADAVSAPLATLTAEALRSAASPAWRNMVPALSRATLRAGRPLMAGATVEMDPRPASDLLGRLAALACSGVSGYAATIPAIPNALALLEASVNQDGERLAVLAAEAGADEGVVATLGHLLALPLLGALGDLAGGPPEDVAWDQGYCPVCAAWPTLAEVRGSERERWLRCGRCGAAWRRPHLTCVYCGNDSHETLGYLAPELTMESRRATTCERCHGYLKSVSTLLPLDLGEVILKDLSTLELDAAALDRGYSRPEIPGYALGVRIKASQ